METPTYIALANYTATGSESSVTFSSIPVTYRHLVIIHNNYGTANNDANSNFVFNNDTTSSYSRVYAFYESTNSPISGSESSATSLKVFGLRTTIGVSTSYIMDYSATDKHKAVLTRTDTPNHLVWMSAGRWAKTEAITSVRLNAFSGNFASGSVIAIYGIAS